MPQVPNFYLDFHVTGSERKRLVSAISEHIGEDAHYLGAPSFAYQVDYFTIDRAGCVSFDNCADSEEIAGLLEALANDGFVSVSSNFALPENSEGEPQIGQTEDSETIPTVESEVSQESVPGAEKTVAPVEIEEITESSETFDEIPIGGGSNNPDTSGLSADTLARLESLRSSLIREINRQFKDFLHVGSTATPHGRVYAQRETSAQIASSGEGAAIPLHGDISTLRGTKPVLVRYNDQTIPATSWKQVVGVVMDICNRQEPYHQALLQARDSIVGRGRKILADSPQGMYSPLKVDEELYLETNFSTEALLRMLRDRILSRIGFDGSGIILEYRRP